MVYQRAKQTSLRKPFPAEGPRLQRTRGSMTCSPASLADTISAGADWRGSRGVLSSGTHRITEGSPACCTLRAVNSAGLYILQATVLTTVTSAVADLGLAGLHAPVGSGSGCFPTGSHSSQGQTPFVSWAGVLIELLIVRPWLQVLP